MSQDAGLGAHAEINRVFKTRTSFYHDTAATKDLVIRENYCYGVVAGIAQSLSAWTLRVGSGLIRTYSTTANQWIAIFTSQTAHGLNTGNTVPINGAVVYGSYSNVFHGSYQRTQL